MNMVRAAEYGAVRAYRMPWLRAVHIALDATVVLGVFSFASFVIWGNWALWEQPLIWPEVFWIMLALVTGKSALLQKPQWSTRARVRVSSAWVIAVYITLALSIMFTRWYYSRPLLLITFVLLIAWQVLHAVLMRLESRRMRLAAVPSAMTAKLQAMPDLDVLPLSLLRLTETVDGVVVDLHEAHSKDWARFIAECAATGIPVFHAAAVYETASARVPLSHLSESFARGFFSGQSAYLPVKRVLDLLIILCALPLVLPLCGVIAVMIRWGSPGPVLFWQHRVGLDGRPFYLVKFRSMRVDSEKDGAKFATKNDDRVTRVGRFLRRFHLDELPQLWNVLKGEMSLIGPRPEQVAFLKQFEREIPFYSWRHSVKPGITGLAQVTQGYAAGVAENAVKLEYDLYYVKHISLALDFTIALRTVAIMFKGAGAR